MSHTFPSLCVAAACSIVASNAFAQPVASTAPPAPSAPVDAGPAPVDAAAPAPSSPPAPTPSATEAPSAPPALAPPPAPVPAATAPADEHHEHHKKDKKKHKDDASKVDGESAKEDVLKESFAGDPFGDDAGGVSAGPLSFRALFQVRYRQTWAHGSTNPRPNYAFREDVLVHDGDGFDLQRLFLRIGSDPLPELGFKAILDFAKLSNPDNVLKQAYVTVRPVPKRVEIAAGILKLPFSTMELDPIARFELSDLGTTDDVIKNLGFGGRDVGVELMVAPLPKPRLLRLSLGAFRGHAQDEHASPLGAIGARIESKPLKSLRIGVDAVGMPTTDDYRRPFDTGSKDVLPNPPDPLFPREQRWAAGKAYSADITFEAHHLMLRGEGLMGDRVDFDRRYGARSFWAAWVLAAYEVHAGFLRFTPVVRAEWLDMDRDHSVGGRRELSAGMSFPYKKRVRLLFDVKRTDVQKGSPVIDPPRPLPAFPYFDLDSTRLSGQLQVEL